MKPPKADAPTDHDETTPRQWPEGPAPYLQQPRAHSALRRELDALAAEWQPRLKGGQARAGDSVADVQSLPNRLVVRLDDVGLTFSWIAGRLGTVADGRLLVIQWAGVTAQGRGGTSLKSATLVREQTYCAESAGPDSWGWRAEEPAGPTCSTKILVSEWFAAMSVASPRALAAATALASGASGA